MGVLETGAVVPAICEIASGGEHRRVYYDIRFHLRAGRDRGKNHAMGDERGGIALGGPPVRCGLWPGTWSSDSLRGRFGAGNVLSAIRHVPGLAVRQILFDHGTGREL